MESNIEKYSGESQKTGDKLPPFKRIKYKVRGPWGKVIAEYDLFPSHCYTAYGIPCPKLSSAQKTAQGYFSGSEKDIDSEEKLEETLRESLPEKIRKELERRFWAYREADKRREPFLLPLLHEIISDPSVQMDEYFQECCKMLFELDYPYGDLIKKNPGLIKIDREVFRSLILEHYWRPKTPKEVLHFYPKGASMEGFLGWGEKLETVIKEDEEVVESLGHTHQEIGLKLKGVLDGESEIHKLKKIQWCGYQECPFAGCQYEKNGRKTCPHSSADYIITNEKTGKKILVPGLIWHLIAEHKFFEGKESSYRVDPKELVEVLFG